MATVSPGRVGPVPLTSVPAALREVSAVRSVLNVNAVAYGVPRVSTDNPLSGWKVFTKSRWSPRSASAFVYDSEAITL